MFDDSVGMVDALTSVVTAPVATLSTDELLDGLSKVRELESVLAARKAELMVGVHASLSGPSADLGRREPRPGDRLAGPAERRWSGDVLRSVSDEIGLVMGAHRKTAARWLNQAALLVDRFPATLGLLRRGGLPVAAAHHIARELAIIVDDELRAVVEQIVHAWGRRYGWAKIKKIAQREARKVVAEYESLLHAQRQWERTTYTKSHDGGMADLIVSTSAIDITAIMAALTVRCRVLQRAGDPRSMDQLRTDLAVHRLLGQDQTATTTSSTAEPTSTSGPSAGPASTSGPSSGPASTSGPSAGPASTSGPSSGPTSASGSSAGPACAPARASEPASDADDGPDAGVGVDSRSWWGGDADAASTAEPVPAGEGGSSADTASADATGAVTDAGTVAVDDDDDADADADADATADATADADADADAAAGPVSAGAAGAVLGAGWLPESGLNPGVGVQVVIHCTYAEAEALATGAICTGGELEGYGGLPQDALAMAFGRARFRYRLTDRSPKSDPARYTPSPGLDQHVRDRDRTCRFPGCNAPVQYCDLDHRVPFPQGRTDEENLGAFCRHHHRLKHRGDWQVYTTDTGTLVFISPTGRAYLAPPAMEDSPALTGQSAVPNAA